jgi:hypothetical protein
VLIYTERMLTDFRNLPVATLNHFMSGDEVTNKEQNAHHNVLCYGRDVGTRDFEDLNALLSGGVEVDMVGANTSGDTIIIE